MRAPPGNDFLSCDWGTSTFRLRWVSNGAIRDEFADSTGCRVVFDSHPADSRPAAFSNQLRSSILRILPSTVEPMPLIISGMASSTIGWRELPYAQLPLRLDGSDLNIQKLDWNPPTAVTDAYLISGAASESEMMRGEETEAIGLMQMLPALSATAMLLLPGTHSKHLRIENGAITHIQTFMTGELYEVLTQSSVLRASVSSGSSVSRNFDHNAFAAGIDHAVSRGLAASLFQTRTRQVLGKHPAESNASFLSGLLIGAELAGLKSTGRLFLAGADSIRHLYSEATNHLGLAAHTFSASEVRLSVPRAHELVLSRLRRPTP